MILYRALHPLLLSIFKAFAILLRNLPAVRKRTEKLWTTFDIRYIDGQPAFLKVDRSKFGGRRPIWIHAASGEFEYAKPIIRELSRQSRPVLVTYFSPTYASNVHAFPGVSAACPLPLDSSDELVQFLEYFNPTALLIARTDAWPNTVFATASRKIPILLFSTTFHDRSNRMRGLARGLTIDTLKMINEIQCVSIEDRSVLNSIGITRSKTCGDSRYDQVLARLENMKSLSPALTSSVYPRALIAGSIWSEDLTPVLKASVSTFATFEHTLLLVPHEISDSFHRKIESAALQSGVAESEMIRFTELLKSSSIDKKYRVIIVDAVGFLAELYTLGEIAFVGGSFRKTVHSVMEPLACGALTIVGPLHTNNREALEFQKLSVDTSRGPVRFVTAVNDESEFTRVLSELWDVSSEIDFKTRIREEVRQRGGATAHVMQWLAEHT